MASKTHVDNTVNERRLRPIYGTYNFIDNEIGSDIRCAHPRRTVRSVSSALRMTRLYNGTQFQVPLGFRLAG